MNIRSAISIGDIPSPGALLGTSGSANLIQTINESLGSASFFGSARDTYAAVTNAFVSNVVQPIREMSQMVSHLSKSLLNVDEFRPLLTREDLMYVPPCMQLPIVTYAPVRKLLEQGRVSGYGYDPDNFPDHDPYETICNSGVIFDVMEACGDNDSCDMVFTWDSEDPDLSMDEVDAIFETRLAIDYILEATLYDPTDPKTERG